MDWKTVSEMITEIIFGNVSELSITIRLGIAAVLLVVQLSLIWASVRLFRWLQNKITTLINNKQPSLTIKKFRILETAQIRNIFDIIIKIAKWVVIVIQLYLTIPLVFSFFEPTQNLAYALLGYILTPLKDVFFSFLHYIPNLITIIVFAIVAKYIVRSLKYFANKVEKEKIILPGFYPDWAQPTFYILRFLIYAFTIAVIYPYLPRSDTRVFQGVSVFVGIIISLGSSSAIGNIVAGLVLTYMRPFKLGDRINIQNVTGFVVEKTPFVIRLRTHKNEYVTFPNSMVLTSSVTDYNTSSVGNGLILNAEVSFSYSIPWQTVHEILIFAAQKTDLIMEEPKPFVLQTALDDFCVRYQINAYTKEIDLVPSIYSDLFINIQNGFKEAGIDMTSAHYRINILEDNRKN